MLDESSSSPSMVSAALTYLEKEPRRSVVLFLMRWYPLMFGVTVSLIMATQAGLYAPRWTFCWIVLYWFYYHTRHLLWGQAVFGLSYRSIWLHFWRALMLLISVNIFLIYIYLYSDYLHVNQIDPTLWLLFLLPVFIMSQRGNLKLLLAINAIALAMFITLMYRTTSQIDIPFYLELVGKIFLLILLPFILYTLIHFVSDWYANIRLLHEVEKKLVQLRSTAEEHQLLATVVTDIADAFKYPHVNIFYLQPDGNMQCVASSDPLGQTLVEQKFTLESGQGIVGHVIQTKETYLANRVSRDPFYLANPLFPKTKAELVVPLKSDDLIFGVLAVQAHQSGAFFPQDVEVMEVMSSYLSVVLNNLRLMRSKQRLDHIVYKIARRFLSQPELNSTLDEIARAAQEELLVDVVVLYERNTLTNKVIGPTYAGQLHQPESFGVTAFEPDSIVQQLLLVADQDYFQETVQEIQPAEMTGNDPIPSKPTFVEREKIKSRAIIRLRADTTCLGLMFLNFRKSRCFDEQEKTAFFSFAHLAALAIQKAQFHQQQIEFERKNIARQLHDQLMANADATSRLIALLLRDDDCTGYQQDQLSIALEAVKELKQDIRYLNETLKDTSLDDIGEEVDKMVHRAKNAYGVKITANWVGQHNYIPTAVSAHLKLILNEAIINAVRHGEANTINLDFDVSNQHVDAVIKDNGRGFHPDRIKPGGLVNMRERAEYLGGQCVVESTPGQGTCIRVHLPYDSIKGAVNA